jgi:hypothetical protein
VTVATDQAMYVIGDSNRGTVNGGVARQPASLIGDSVNVFSSNYWRSGVAAICGVNCCIDQFCRMARARNPSPAAAHRTEHLGQRRIPRRRRQHEWDPYNGGLENYPRFHEDWGGTTLTYQGRSSPSATRRT